MNTVPVSLLFDEIVGFLAARPNSAAIIAFQPLEALKQRSSYLLEHNREGTLTTDERTELDEFMRLNHFMNRLKIRAHLHLASELHV